MSNDTTDKKVLSPELEKAIDESLCNMYDAAITHAIIIIQRHYNSLPSPSPNHFNNELDKIVGELEQLKNKKV